MSTVLPLEVLGLMGPILCWVEGGRGPGLPESWHATHFSFEEKVRHWLMNELPTYSYDSLDEVISLAGDRRVDFIFPMEPRRSRAKELESVKIPPRGFDLVCVFSQLARRYFQWAGNELCIRENRMVELHELAMRFPVRHLIQYSYADAVTRGYISSEKALKLPCQMSQLPTTYRSLRSVVDKGLSEGHLHLNGVINADEAWSDQMLLRFSPGSREGLSAESKRLLILGRAVIKLLAVGLVYACIDDGDIDLPSHLVVLLDKLYRAKSPAEYQATRSDLMEQFSSKLKSFRDDIGKKLSVEKCEKLQWLMPLINSDMNFNLIRRSRQNQVEDIFEEIGTRLRIRLLKQLHLNVNRVLIERNIRSLPNGSNGDTHESGSGTGGWGPKQNAVREFLHQLAYRYVIYHTHHWQEATQSGKTTGLRKFQYYFDSPQREIVSRNHTDFYGFAVERLSMAKPLRNVEGRLSPPTHGASKYLPWVLAFARQVNSDYLDKFGIVVHFKKDRHEKAKWKHHRKTVHRCRYGKIRRLTQRDAFKLFRLLSTPHLVVPFIVGIDAANLELTTPPEVFAPAFRFLREYPIKLRHFSSTKEKFGKFDDVAALVEKRRLGLTYHVGEDFRHLLSGLRAIHEVIEFLKPLPGDRLGHAIALALKPEIWAGQVGYQAAMPRQEWLDTLVWLHYLLGAGHDLIGQLAIEDQIQRHSRAIYGKAVFYDLSCEPRRREREWIPITLYDSWRLRQLDPYSVKINRDMHRLKFSIRQRGRGPEHLRWADVQTVVLNEVDRHIGTDAAFELVRHYWYEPDVFDRGSRIIKVEMQDDKKLWMAVFSEVQERMQDMVRDKQLVVEVNPSSNRIIGPMASMAEHPIFQLTLDKQHQMEKRIRVTINTDDPGVFSTSLAHEFYLMGESLLARGIPEPEVVEWLDWLRINGSDYSFLHGLAGASDKHMNSILNFLLKENVPVLERLEGKRRKYKPTVGYLHSDQRTVDELNRLKFRLRELEEKHTK